VVSMSEQPRSGEPPDSSEFGESSTTPRSGHDPQGLELARALAGRLKGIKPGPPRKPWRRKRNPPAEVSGARPDDRDPQLLNATIGRLMRDQGWEVDIAVHGVMARWPAIVGPEVAQHCSPERYADTELTVRTDSTAWATQVRMLAPDLVRRLNAELGDGTVTRVTVLGPNAPTWRKGPRTVRGGRGPRDTYG
jgi:predicted nucleic acid-binding Zn ribbon protein